MRISATMIKHLFLVAAAFAAWAVGAAPRALAADHAVIVMYHRFGESRYPIDQRDDEAAGSAHCASEAWQVYSLAAEENRRGDQSGRAFAR